MRTTLAAMTLVAGLSSAAQAEEKDLSTLARAFLDRPVQQHDIGVALTAKAEHLPGLCPAIRFTPTELFVKTPPRPIFNDAGDLVDGGLRQRYSSAGCGKFEPIFNVWVITAPGQPLRTITTVPGTSRTYVDLQEKVVATLGDAARHAIPDCKGLTVVDTKLRGFDTPTDVPTGPFREDWLLGGCGKLAVVKLHFIPEKDKQNMRVELDGPAVPAEMR